MVYPGMCLLEGTNLSEGRGTTRPFELVGAQSSYLEGEVFNEVVQREGIAAVSALTRSQQAGQTLTLVDSSNVGQVLAIP